MTPILRPEEIRERDRLIIEETGIPESTLIENAARGAIDAVLESFAETMHLTRRWLVLCGPGNNGADGMAFARLSASVDRQVTIALSSPEETLNRAASEQLAICRALPEIDEVEIAEIGGNISNEFGLVVDAMLGTGVAPPLRPPYPELLRTLSRYSGITISLDLPTGLDPVSGMVVGEHFVADLTATMGALKPGLLFNQGPDSSGSLYLVGLGVPDRLYRSEANLLNREVASIGIELPRRTDHKYDCGTCTIIAGSSRMPGAAVLATTAAVNSGAGLVQLGMPDSALRSVRATLSPEVIATSLPEIGGELALDEASGLSQKTGSLLIGPGLGRSDEILGSIRSLLTLQVPRLVLDADALDAEVLELVRARELDTEVVLTPHHGEMSRLTGIGVETIAQDPIAHARALSADCGAIVVLKGAPTVVAEPGGSVVVNAVGNAGMASAGTGDLLSGLIVGMLAADSEIPCWRRVATAVWIHSRAGDLALQRVGNTLSLHAADLIVHISEAISELTGGASE